MEQIKSKGFNIVTGSTRDIDPNQKTGYQALNGTNVPSIDFNKIKVGAKVLEDAVLDLGNLKKINPELADKDNVLRAINNYDLKLMREISLYFYRTSGIYSRLVRYMAFMYRYDSFLTPYVNGDNIKTEKVLDGFYKGLNILDNFKVKKTLGEIALQVVKQGCYYGYKVSTATGIVLQELPADYCRVRFKRGNKPVVEFNMKFFDENFRDMEQRAKILKMFPKEFSKGYVLYRQGKLPPLFQGDTIGWYMLDPEQTVKFTVNGEDYPPFISVIPLILDLDAAQDLDRQKTMQRLLKIVIQKIPLDKNGELLFDIDEIQQLHNNAVMMLARAIGVDVLTSFADVSVEDMSDDSSVQTDDLERVERQLYNEAGVSQLQFNSNGNIALNNSILNDEATMYNMLLQFEDFLNELLEPLNKTPKKLQYKVQLLTTTIYNYKDLAKMYKEQTQMGYSKMLPQIALGQSQSSILATAYFENDILDLLHVFIPPVMSSTMSADLLNHNDDGKDNKNSNQTSSKQKLVPSDNNEVGRKEKADNEKSEKTIQNKESMS